MAENQRSLPAQAVQLALDVANGRHFLSRLVAPALLAVDAALCALIIWKVPYTEIDWEAYMQQVSQVVSGERDYTKIQGGTGPLVYPAGHVYIYTALYYLTDKGTDIFLAQKIFAALYMVTLGLVMACYAQAKAPPYILPLLVLSKRLHSIFVLRCFNDCLAVFFLWLAIFFLQRRSWTLGGLAYSLGVSVKMSLLLGLPAVGLVVFLGRGLGGALRVALTMAELQVLLGLPFMRTSLWGYLGRAFELSRRFLFKWTVNWRFVGEEVFLSKGFSATLLALHVSVLLAFVTTRWLRPTRKTLLQIATPILLSGGNRSPFATEEEARRVAGAVTPRYVLTSVLSAILVGLLFARSLHYQFYAYLAWTTPYLLWRSGVHPVLLYALWALQEWAWNIYPSTPVSSGVVVGVMAVTTAAVLAGAKEEFEPVRTESARAAEDKSTGRSS